MTKEPLYGREDIPIELSSCVPYELADAFHSYSCPTVQKAYALLYRHKKGGGLDTLLPVFGDDVEPLEKILADIERTFIIDRSHPEYWSAA